MELLIVVGLLLTLDLTAMRYGADSRRIRPRVQTQHRAL